MASVKPPLYVSRVLPDPVMAAIRERFELVREPLDDSSAPSALQSGLSESVAAIVTLTDRLDADVLAAAPRLKIVANYAVGYNNIDVDAARQRGIVVTNTPDVLTDATADLTWALILATARRVIEGDRLVRSGQWTGWTPTQLLGTAVAVMADAGRAGIANPGAHGFSEILYAFTSAANNNGSAFAGLGANSPFYNVALAVAMWLGRFGVIVPVLAMAGSLAAKKRLAVTGGTMPTHGALFAALLVGTVLLVGLLNYVPALALGPVVEHLMLWK